MKSTIKFILAAVVIALASCNAKPETSVSDSQDSVVIETTVPDSTIQVDTTAQVPADTTGVK